MEIHLNGELMYVVAVNIGELVHELGMERRMIAVERNMEVVPNSAYTETRLEPGDHIELVHMIGGG